MCLVCANIGRTKRTPVFPANLARSSAVLEALLQNFATTPIIYYSNFDEAGLASRGSGPESSSRAAGKRRYSDRVASFMDAFSEAVQRYAPRGGVRRRTGYGCEKWRG